ncbi:cold-active aminopeptidase [endosymbiont of Acanthamoeba sp. UWC8]|uniref:M1 family metallopeptidase n=1 Tax=endosymbiont of Acanthamoeba sp. UWC8 TaxID=86106 RepID=UPI0004D0CCA1|nr:M1 family metallopeptidase [endosymbiont of Acanthamoeba sp. UWC8]AIF82081.1 cold-active aminopeptidase [endosymbiont of Acanthamoeba sp. UWC8]
MKHIFKVTGANKALIIAFTAIGTGVVACTPGYVGHPKDVNPILATGYDASVFSKPKHTEHQMNYSYSNPEQVSVRHIDIDWNVMLDSKTIEGSVILSIDKKDFLTNQPLILDSRDLVIRKIEGSSDKITFSPIIYKLGKRDPIKGQAIIIPLQDSTNYIRIKYSTSPTAEGLHWIKSEQSEYSSLFTVACPIHARDFIPLQDTPQVRITYTAKIQSKPEFLVLMSASNNPKSKSSNGYYEFEMNNPIPPYLISLAIGDFKFKQLSNYIGIYANPSYIERGITEFADLNKMMKVAESLYGPYLWSRYDLLILPNTFPAGAMENPSLTFVSPTIITGDKSFVSVIAHELAHSWSGNLVTNATWNDIWLNEGITTYMQNRIVEEVYGKKQAEIEVRLSYEQLLKAYKILAPEDLILNQKFRNPNPDDVFTPVPYNKGFLFIKHLEQLFGRSEIDNFLREYTREFAFKAISTNDFEQYLRKHLLNKNSRLSQRASIKEWLYGTDLPTTFIEPSKRHLIAIGNQAKEWAADEITQIDTAGWRGQQWIYFIDNLPTKLSPNKLEELNKILNIKNSRNALIISKWLTLAIANNYEPAYGSLERYLTIIGKMSLIKPIYEELVKTNEGLKIANHIYNKAKPFYHSLTIREINKVFEKAGKD